MNFVINNCDVRASSFQALADALPAGAKAYLPAGIGSHNRKWLLNADSWDDLKGHTGELMLAVEYPAADERVVSNKLASTSGVAGFYENLRTLLSEQAQAIVKQSEAMTEQIQAVVKTQSEAKTELTQATQAIKDLTLQIGQTRKKISSVCYTEGAALFPQLGFVAVLRGDFDEIVTDPTIKSVDIDLFRWDADAGTEVKNSPELASHLSLQLSKFGITFGKKGYEVKEVRSDTSLLTFTLGSMTYTGTTDALVMPDGNASWAQQGRMAAEFKTPTAAKNFSKAVGPAAVELVGLCAKAQHPVAIICTDLKEHFTMLWPRGDSILSFHNYSGSCGIKHAANLTSVAQGIQLVAHYLKHECSPEPAYDFKRAFGAAPESEALRALKRVKAAMGVDGGEGFRQQLDVIDALPPAERSRCVDELVATWFGHSDHCSQMYG